MRRAGRWAVLGLVALIGLAGCESLLTRPILYGRIVVEARSREGEPLPGIFTILYTGARPMGYARTGPDGRAVFPQVPPSQYGVLLALPDSIADLSEIEGGPPGYFVDGLDVTGSTDTTLMFTFVPRTAGAAEALVRDSAGAPLENIRVYFYRPGGVVGSTTTGPDGIARYEPFPLGQAGAYVIPSDTLGIPNSPAVFRDGMVVTGFVAPRVEFTLPTCFGAARVLVLDDRDAPVPDMDVNLYDSQALRRVRPTNASGRVELTRVGCGNYGIGLGVPRAGYDIVPGRGTAFVDGLDIRPDTTYEITLRMIRLP